MLDTVRSAFGRVIWTRRLCPGIMIGTLGHCGKRCLPPYRLSQTVAGGIGDGAPGPGTRRPAGGPRRAADETLRQFCLNHASPDAPQRWRKDLGRLTQSGLGI